MDAKMAHEQIQHIRSGIPVKRILFPQQCILSRDAITERINSKQKAKKESLLSDEWKVVEGLLPLLCLNACEDSDFARPLWSSTHRWLVADLFKEHGDDMAGQF